MSEETSSSATGMDSSDVTAKPAKGGPSRGLVIGGLLAIVVIAGVILVSTDSDAPRSGTASCATTSTQCKIGDIGPGGGKVFSLGSATAPADCTRVVCLEVAPLAWQDLRATSTTTDLRSTLETATSTVAGYSTTNAAAGTWRLPTQAELTKLATLPSTDQAKVNGFRDVSSLYWSSTTGRTYNRDTSLFTDSAYVRSIQNDYGQVPRTTSTIYSRPIHPF
jgi:hypothetical protein